MHPALLAKDSVVVGQGLVHTQVTVLLLSSGHRREAQEQRCCGQPHGPAHGHLERKESSELPGPLQGVPFPPTAAAPGAHLVGREPSARQGEGRAQPGLRQLSATRTQVPWAALGLLPAGFSLQSWPRPLLRLCRAVLWPVPAAAWGTGQTAERQSGRAHLSLSHGPPRPGHTSYPEFPVCSQLAEGQPAPLALRQTPGRLVAPGFGSWGCS